MCFRHREELVQDLPQSIARYIYEGRYLHEHRCIFQNIADGNETGAEKAMKEHLEYIHHDLKIVQRKYPEYFKD